MNQLTGLPIRYYIYLDEQGIDSIYSQLNDEFISEKLVRNGKTVSGQLKSGFSHIFSSLVNIESSVEGESTNIVEGKISYTYEQKLKQILKIVSKPGDYNYYSSLYEATQRQIQGNEMTFVNIHDKFYSRFDFSSFDVYQSVITNSFFEFEKGDTPISNNTFIASYPPYDSYDYSDSYYRNSRYRVVFSMNVDKLKISYKSVTSHFGVLLRAAGRDGVYFGIFGQIRSINDLYYQIKPFAVWV